ncbi:MAG: metallophosphoesterase [Methylococcales bacterium]|nr:metallophosphoesterase [Methylococcales bacterium]
MHNPAKSHLATTVKPISLLLLIVFSVLGLWAFWFEPSRFITTQTTIKLPLWPSSCDGLKIVVLADLHVGSPHNHLDNLVKVVEATNALHPDLILLAGDYVIHEVVGGSFVRPEPIARELKKLSAKLGVYAVLGNHDWWYSAASVKSAFHDNGIRLLENDSLHLQSGTCDFWLAGIGDFWGGHYDTKRAMQAIPNAATVIAFTHNPDIFYELPEDIAITFAGHTHGGQVSLPLLGRLIVPSRYGEKFAIGTITEGGRTMFVTTGIGTSILPVRFRVPPEIAVVVLGAKN